MGINLNMKGRCKMSVSNFERFQLKPFLIKGIEEQNFSLPTEIQERLIPSIMNGKDAIGQSQTGTGKTLAYLLPLLSKINPKELEVQAVITAPTRELAKQIFSEIEKLTKHCDEDAIINAKCLVGGTDRQKTIGKLNKMPHIIVGTPGRLSDLVNEQALSVHKTKILVVDEADVMLDMGFIREVDQLAGRMNEDLQMLVFSATIPESLQPFMKKYMSNPKFVEAKGDQRGKNKIEHIILPVRHREKNELLFELTKTINPYLCIIFTNTKTKADEVADALLSFGLKVSRLHGNLKPRERNKVMKDVRDIKVQFLVATDIAARGIDIKGISHVINYELPDDLDFYVHRTGRTGRAGADGIAITLFEDKDEAAIHKLESKGVTFNYRDIQKDELVEIKPLKRKRVKRTKVEEKVTSQFQKPKKVKPGYKKKFKQQQQKQQQQQRQKSNRNK
jgi:ATP-dependent RNA helicase CshB